MQLLPVITTNIKRTSLDMILLPYVFDSFISQNANDTQNKGSNDSGKNKEHPHGSFNSCISGEKN